MIEMTLHAVTVRCETLPEALSLLDRWARMGEITLPPAPREVNPAGTYEPPFPDFLRRAYEETIAAAGAAVAPAPPTKRRARGTLPEKECAVCGDPFTSPSPRTVTCERHRMKPGQKLADVQKAYARERAAKTAAKPAPDRAAAKGLLARPPIKPNEPTKPCSACGDKTRAADLDAKGRCRDCQPIGGKS